MQDTSIFCLTLDPSHEDLIKKLSYIPVGVGERNFSIDCLNDKKGENISNKNSFYGEYTFHYWIWKNYLDKIQTNWVGFCQYRKFFVKRKISDSEISLTDLSNLLIKKIDQKKENFDCILGNKFSVENYKFSKIIKNHLFQFIRNPILLIDKKKRNLKFHFDLFHGLGNFEKAVDLLDNENKSDFLNYMNTSNAFNPHNMFICKKEILKRYYETVFPWLERCEKIFGFNQTDNYGLRRIYGFLAERFLSYWFNKNYKIKEYPIFFKNLSDYKDL